MSDRLIGILMPFYQPLAAILASLVLFGAFMIFAGRNPFEVYQLMAVGAFGSWFSLQNTLQRAAPLLLTALCTALPAQMGLVIIGGEGAFVMGGLGAMAVGLPLSDAGLPPLVVQLAMAFAGMAAGGLFIASAGALRHWRGVNETISSLLLSSIAIAVLNQVVEGIMRDPTSLNKPSTRALPDDDMLGTLPGMDVHIGLAVGLVACLAAWILTSRTTFGFAARMVGGNPRAARMAGLPVGLMIVVMCALAGAAAGVAGMIEVSAVQGRANANIAAGYGVTGILVAFLARQNPLAIIPVAVLLGGIGASGGLLQRRLDLPDATVLVLQGISSSSFSPAKAFPRSAISGCRLQPRESRNRSGRSPTLRRLRRPAAKRRRSAMPKRPKALEWLGIKTCTQGRKTDERPDPRPVDGADRHARRRDPGLDAVSFRQPRRIGDGKERAHQSRPGGQSRHGCDERFRHRLSHRFRVAGRLGRRRRGHPVRCLACRHLLVAARERHCRRLRTDAVGNRSCLLPRQAPDPTESADPSSARPRLLERHPADPRGLAGQRLVYRRYNSHRPAQMGPGQYALGHASARCRRLLGSRPCMGYSPRATRLAATCFGGFMAGVGGSFLSLYYPGSWNEGLSSGQGITAVALVIFARWNPVGCFLASLLFGAAGALGPPLQAVGVTAGTYLFNAAPYILTLAILILSSSSRHRIAGAPGELSVTR